MHFWLSQLGGVCYRHPAGGGQDAAKDLTEYREAPTTNNYPPNDTPCMEARKRAALLVEVHNLANNRDLVTETEFQNTQLIQS